jgi:hypothetical protein
MNDFIVPNAKHNKSISFVKSVTKTQDVMK